MLADDAVLLAKEVEHCGISNNNSLAEIRSTSSFGRFPGRIKNMLGKQTTRVIQHANSEISGRVFASTISPCWLL